MTAPYVAALQAARALDLAAAAVVIAADAWLVNASKPKADRSASLATDLAAAVKTWRNARDALDAAEKAMKTGT